MDGVLDVVDNELVMFNLIKVRTKTAMMITHVHAEYVDFHASQIVVTSPSTMHRLCILLESVTDRRLQNVVANTDVPIHISTHQAGKYRVYEQERKVEWIV